MNDPTALANSIASRQAQKTQILANIQFLSTETASKIAKVRVLHSTRREALLYAILQLDDDLGRSETKLIEEGSQLEVKMREELRGLEAQIEQDRKAMAIIRLPVEILAYIFQHSVEGDSGMKGGAGLGMSPRTLAMVNKLWCNVALRTPSLWGTILVTDSWTFYWDLARNSGVPRLRTSRYTEAAMHSAMQICVTATQLDRCLRNSGATPLYITFTFSSRLGDNPANDLCQMIFNSQIAPRVANLTLEEGGVCPNSPALNTYLSSAVCPFTNLISLDFFSCFRRVGSIKNPLLPQVVLENAQKLRELTFDDSFAPSWLSRETWQGTKYGSTIERVKRVTVYDANVLKDIFGKVVPVPEVVIRAASRVEAADPEHVWDIFTTAWPVTWTPQMTFTRLTRIHLILHDLSALSRVTIPLLEHLRITHENIRVDDRPLGIPDFAIEFPKLRTMRILGPRFAHLNRISVPQLETLHLTSRSTAKAKIEADFALLFPSTLSDAPELSGQITFASPSAFIHTFYINANVSEIFLLQALHSLPLLQVLTLVPGRQFGHALVKELTVGKPKGLPKGTPNSLLCPELRILELDFYSFVEWDKNGRGWRVGTSTADGIPELLQKLVASRNKGGKHPLERVSMTTKAVGGSHKAHREFI